MALREMWDTRHIRACRGQQRTRNSCIISRAELRVSRAVSECECEHVAAREGGPVCEHDSCYENADDFGNAVDTCKNHSTTNRILNRFQLTHRAISVRRSSFVKSRLPAPVSNGKIRPAGALRGQPYSVARCKAASQAASVLQNHPCHHQPW